MPTTIKVRRTFFCTDMLRILEAAARETEMKYRPLMQDACIDIDDLIIEAWFYQARYMKSEDEVRKRLYLNAKRFMFQYLQRAYRQNIIRKLIREANAKL